MVTPRTVALLIGLLLLPVPGVVQARVAAEGSFPASGWSQAAADSLAAPVSFAGASRGALVFELRRTGDIPFSRPETLFELVDAAGRRVLRVKLSWTGEAGSGLPSLHFQGAGDDYRRHGMGLWGPVVELDKPVSPGQRVRIQLSWDDATGACEVYLDGAVQKSFHGGFDPVLKSWYPDRRAQVNAALAREGKAAFFEARPLGTLLSRVATIRLGNYDAPGRNPQRPRSLLQHALLDGFMVFVDEIPPPGQSGPPPVIASVEHDAARAAGISGRLVAGDSLSVTLRGTPGATGSFDVLHYPDLGGRIDLDWRGWGVYLEEKVFYQPGEVNLADVAAYRVYASPAPIDLAAPGLEPLATLPPSQQRHTLDLLTVDQPYHVAVLAEMRDGTLRLVIAPLSGLPLAENEPGVYTGSYAVDYQSRYPRAVVVGRLTRGEATATLAGDRRNAFAIDPALRIAVETEPKEVKADERSLCRVTVSVTDANGAAVRGRKIRFLLATTSRYTGVVGGGSLASPVGSSLLENQWGETDLFGRFTATYVAGFAAKTAIIVARDMGSNDTGAGWVKTSIQAEAQLLLEPVQATAAGEGYQIAVTANHDWLTADGRSEARITARVTLGGKPVEGHRVSFDLAGAGSLRVVRDLTDREGEARAVYTAGRKAGTVLVTATDTTIGIAGAVAIELRADAPAKIRLKLDPERLPADGRSRAELLVQVTDVNDNPTGDVAVEYRIVSGDGRLRDESGVTDRSGESAVAYTAGRSPGPVLFQVTVHSSDPTGEELAAARSLAVAVPDGN
jgi:hypothetical protein